MITRITIVIALSLTTSNINSQDTVYYDSNNKPVSRYSAFYYEISCNGDSIKPGHTAESFYMNGSRRKFTKWSDKSRDKIITMKEWYPAGQLKMQRVFHGSGLNDTLITFWENGEPKREDIHRNGKFIRGTCYNRSGEKIPHFDYEIMPIYPGGDNQLFADIYNSITLPESMKSGNLDEKVIARFSVDTEGSVGEIEIVEGRYAELNKEVVRVLTLLRRWQPGKLDGEAVKIWYTVPVSFSVINGPQRIR